MRRGEIIRELRASGFWVLRNGKRHDYWSNGKQRLTLSKGSKWSEEMIRTLCIAIKRARQ